MLGGWAGGAWLAYSGSLHHLASLGLQGLHLLSDYPVALAASVALTRSTSRSVLVGSARIDQDMRTPSSNIFVLSRTNYDLES